MGNNTHIYIDILIYMHNIIFNCGKHRLFDQYLQSFILFLSTGSDSIPNMTVMRLGEDYKGMKARAWAAQGIIENVKKRPLGGWVVGSDG